MNYQTIALWSQVLGALAFAAMVIWAFNKYLAPAVAAATRAKNEEIAVAERRRDEARVAAQAAGAEVTEAERSVVSIRERAEIDAKREAEHIVAEARADADRIVRNANGELDRARMAARDAFRVELIEKALVAARTQAASQIDARRNTELVGQFVERLERGEQR